MGSLEPWNLGTGEEEERTFGPLALVASSIWGLSHVRGGITLLQEQGSNRGNAGPAPLGQGMERDC